MLYPNDTLADLYDPDNMPPELSNAHREYDRAVMLLYGMTKVVDGKKRLINKTECIARLIEMYKEKREGE